MTFLHRPTLIVLGVAVIFVLALSACNTVRGFGQDMQSAGQHIKNAAR